MRCSWETYNNLKMKTFGEKTVFKLVIDKWVFKYKCAHGNQWTKKNAKLFFLIFSSFVISKRAHLLILIRGRTGSVDSSFSQIYRKYINTEGGNANAHRITKNTWTRLSGEYSSIKLHVWRNNVFGSATWHREF